MGGIGTVCVKEARDASVSKADRRNTALQNESAVRWVLRQDGQGRRAPEGGPEWG